MWLTWRLNCNWVDILSLQFKKHVFEHRGPFLTHICDTNSELPYPLLLYLALLNVAFFLRWNLLRCHVTCVWNTQPPVTEVPYLGHVVSRASSVHCEIWSEVQEKRLESKPWSFASHEWLKTFITISVQHVHLTRTEQMQFISVLFFTWIFLFYLYIRLPNYMITHLICAATIIIIRCWIIG